MLFWFLLTTSTYMSLAQCYHDTMKTGFGQECVVVERTENPGVIRGFPSKFGFFPYKHPVLRCRHGKLVDGACVWTELVPKG